MDTDEIKRIEAQEAISLKLQEITTLSIALEPNEISQIMELTSKIEVIVGD